jgi:hypothetical protein
LVAESELNRAQLSGEWEAITYQARDLARRANTIAAWASSAALLMTGMAAWRRSSPAPRVGKSSWFEKLLKGARLASVIWVAFRPRHQTEKHK